MRDHASASIGPSMVSAPTTHPTRTRRKTRHVSMIRSSARCMPESAANVLRRFAARARVPEASPEDGRPRHVDLPLRRPRRRRTGASSVTITRGSPTSAIPSGFWWSPRNRRSWHPASGHFVIGSRPPRASRAARGEGDGDVSVAGCTAVQPRPSVVGRSARAPIHAASRGDPMSAQPIPFLAAVPQIRLELSVTDREVVAELERRPEGPERNELAPTRSASACSRCARRRARLTSSRSTDRRALLAAERARRNGDVSRESPRRRSGALCRRRERADVQKGNGRRSAPTLAADETHLYVGVPGGIWCVVR